MGSKNRDWPVVSSDECVDFVSELVAIPSTSGEEQAVAGFLAEHLRQIEGIEVEEIPPANVVATLSGGLSGPRRLFMTHTDTMASGGMENAFTPQRVDGAAFGKSGTVLRGLGAAAPKGAVGAMVMALAAVAANREALKGSVQLAAVTKDLKSDHAGVKEIVAVRPLEADWAVVGEPSGNRLVVGARGIVHVRAAFTGVPAHCGRPQDAANPLFGVADLLVAMRVADLPQHTELGVATTAPFHVESEAVPPQSPSRASLMIDRRTLPFEDTESVVAEIAAMATDATRNTDGLESEVAALRAMHPFAIEPDAPLVRAARSAISGALQRDPGIMSISFSSNAGYTTKELGIQSVGFGPAEITDLGANEHVAVEALEVAARAYLALMVMDGP